MSTHELKCWPHAFDAIKDGRKTFEVRSNKDRDFDAGDYLLLRRWDPERRASGGYSSGTYVSADDTATPFAERAETISALVTYVLHGGRFGLPEGLCVMSIAPVQVRAKENRS
jgi:hypothetical protein